MKISNLLLIALLSVFVFTTSCTTKTGVSDEDEKMAGQQEATTEETTAATGAFGETITDGDIINSDMVLASLGESESVSLRVEGEIKEVCQMKGCWLTMDIGNGETMRVTFKDYGFFVPKNSAGYFAILEGEVSRELVDVETLQHYAEDAGKSQEDIDAITEPEEALNFVASGVMIKEEIGA